MRAETLDRIEGFKQRQAQIEWEMHQYWAPHKGQAPIAYALFRLWVRYIFLQCGRKMGKTDLAVYAMYLFAILFPNSQIYYIADTMKHGAELIWENGRLPKFFLKPKRMPLETNAMFDKRKKWGEYLHDKYVLKATNDDYRLQFKNGSFIKIDGSEQYSNADGIEPDFLVYDEFKHHDPRYHEAAEPNLRVKKAPLLILGTPPDIANTYYEKIANQFKRLSYAKYFRLPSYLNDILYPKGAEDEEFLEEYNKYLPDDEDVAKRELLAEIVISGSKSIFPTLDIPKMDVDLEEGDSKVTKGSFTRHWKSYEETVAKIQRSIKDWEFHAVYDPASSSTFGVLLLAKNKYTKQVIALDCMYKTKIEEMSTMVVFPESLVLMEQINKDLSEWDMTYDNAAKWFANEVQYNYEQYSLNPCDKDLKNKEEKLGQIKDMMSKKYDKFFMTDRCWWLLWEMMNYRKDPNGKIPKVNDHLIDTLRYGLNAMGYDFNELHPVAPSADSDLIRVAKEGENNYSYTEQDITPQEEFYDDGDRWSDDW